MTAGILKTPRLATADVCDAVGSDAAVLSVDFRDFGGRRDFAGPAVTVRTLDDNSKVKELLATQGEGRVLVVDGEGSCRTALLGGNLAVDANRNGWAGVIVFGCIRDKHELIREDIGIKALSSCPRKTEKLGRGEVDVEVAFGGVTIHPGDWVIADADGVVVTRELPEL